jgi:hypothetical protein
MDQLGLSIGATTSRSGAAPKNHRKDTRDLETEDFRNEGTSVMIFHRYYNSEHVPDIANFSKEL